MTPEARAAEVLDQTYGRGVDRQALGEAIAAAIRDAVAAEREQLRTVAAECARFLALSNVYDLARQDGLLKKLDAIRAG